MSFDSQHMQQVATQLLAGMLANPHLYASVSEEGGYGQQEQELIVTAIQMAESLIKKTQLTRSEQS